ncbi:MAG: hypothetical protein IPH62_19410 [Ignavibacteriae bacterium]|nr:hypothetical protein [Ignavibacteriota bacterium]
MSNSKALIITISKTETLFIISNINRIKTKIKEDSLEIERCLNILKNENIQYFNKLNTLEMEIGLLRVQNNVNIKIDTYSNQEIDEEIKQEFKKIFRKISQKCHPDKTEDENLHNIFHSAKKAYDKYDFEELIKIYKDLYDDTFDDKLNILLFQLKEIENEYRQFTNTKSFHIMKLFNSKLNSESMMSRKIYLETLFDKIIELEDLKIILTKQTGTVK